MEAPQQLEVEVHLHVEVVQAEVAEVAIEERVVGDLMEGLAARVPEPVVVAEVVAEQAVLRDQLRLQSGARVGLGAAEVGGILDVALHEPQVERRISSIVVSGSNMSRL